MKRSDAFRKIRTICQRLDEIDLATFPIEPLKLYLFGSSLTDKPIPDDIDLVLVFNRGRSIKIKDIVMAMSYGRPLPFERACIELRRGMKMVKIQGAQGSLDDWEGQDILLAGAKLRLIWRPSFDWATTLVEIERSPQPWPGARPPEAKEQTQAFIDAMSYEERAARLAQAIAEIEAQEG